ncbi:MAG: molybdopterin-dependent oxidoreductase [Pseudonocardia sp.]|nr:molybdopterin-dependent oxidoreductase [Pseudonocardia sp.]
MNRSGLPALAGLLAVVSGAAVAELVAALLGRPQAGTVVAVGAVLVDAAPTPVKELAVATLGTADKPVLLGGIAVVLAVLAAGLGVVAFRDRVAGLAGVAVLGLVGVAAAVTRPAAELVDALPSLVGALAIAGALLVLLRRLPAAAIERKRLWVHSTHRKPLSVHVDRASAAAAEGSGDRRTGHPGPDDLAAPPDEAAGGAVDRRAFLGAAALVAAGAAATGGVAALLGRSATSTRVRESVRLPAPTEPAPPLPAGVEPGFVTANPDFYRVDTALIVPRVDLDSWRLTIDGMVGSPAELSFAELLDRPLVERVVTLNCVSNEVGGPYIGTARWLGVPLAPLLREAGVRPGADQLLARSVDGMTIGTPMAAVFDGREPLLCVGMNGEPLPPEHGFPVRMLTPGLYGYVGACKWLGELKATTFADVDAYWVERGWAPQGTVKTASRIDTPAPFASLTPGPVPIAGVAWAQGRGIRAVELRVDDGAWQQATLLPVPSVDTWVQWRYPWPATPGSHTLSVRATDGTGAVQPEQRVDPFPDGATGWHTITVSVG